MVQLIITIYSCQIKTNNSALEQCKMKPIKMQHAKRA